MSLKVAVLGAAGRMGSEACRAIERTDDLELVARLGSADRRDEIVAAGAQVAVDLTRGYPSPQDRLLSGVDGEL